MSTALESSAAGLVVGATDPASMVAFLGAFGLEEVSGTEVPAPAAEVLYGELAHGAGEETTASEVELGTPGAASPRVWVVGCSTPGTAPRDFQRRPRALDIYTTSMDDALDHLRFVGLAPGPVGALSVGPVTMRQCLVPGPDGMAVVLVESGHRRASLLDSDDGRLFSEGHSVVWCVDSMDDEAALLAGCGLAKGMDLAFSEPEVSTYLDLPRSPVPIRMTMLSGESVDPLRLELLEFAADDGPPETPRTLRGGLWALRHVVQDVAATAEALDAAGFAVRRGGGVAAAESPGGVRLQLVP